MINSVSIILPGLDNFIREIMIYSGFMSRSGLFNGKIGICLLLYHYSRFIRSKEIESYAGYLFHEIYAAIDGKNLSDFICLAWLTDHLIFEGFIKTDKEKISAKVDSFLWIESGLNPNVEKNNKQLFETGVYIIGKILHDKNGWYERGLVWLQSVDSLMFTYGKPNIALLLLALAFCQSLRQSGIQFSPKEYLNKDLPFFIEKAYFDIGCKISRLFLYFLSNKEFPESFNKFSPVADWPLTLIDINKFYWYRLLYGNIATPDFFCEKITSVISDKKLQDELIKNANPENIGLNCYMGGLSWALLQYGVERTS